MWFLYVAILIILIMIVGCTYSQMDRTSACFREGKYNLNSCDDVTPFCDIGKIRYRLPDDLIQTIINHVKNEKVGVRVEVPFVKAGRTLTSDHVQQYLPGVFDEYEKLIPLVSRMVGEQVDKAPSNTSLSACVIVYDREKDHINWHYDENYFKGRFFTVLIPVTSEPTCTNFQFRTEKGTTETVNLGPHDALIFEGSKIWHRATPLCKDQVRIIVSLQFTTDARIMNAPLMWLKSVMFKGIY